MPSTFLCAVCVKSSAESAPQTLSSTISDIGASSVICEIVTFPKTAKIESFTRRKGSRIEQVVVTSQAPREVTHDVMNKGPSIARITSKAVIKDASRAKVYPPLDPCRAATNPLFANFCSTFAINGVDILYISAMSPALHDPRPPCIAKCFSAIKP
jgi:hypothetical protein